MKPPTWLAAPLYLWALPNALLGLMLAIWGEPISWKWHQGALVIKVLDIYGGKRIIGQTWGWVVLIHYKEDNPAFLVHEFVHVKQQLVLGVIFYLLYVGHYVALRARGMNHRAAYRAIWFEKVAYQVQEEFAAGKRPGAWGS